MQEYPKMLYHPDGRTLTVDDQAAEDEAEGFLTVEEFHVAEDKPKKKSRPVADA